MRRIVARLRALPLNENNVLQATALLVGALAGVSAIALEFLLRVVEHAFLGADGVETGSVLRVFLAPVAGGLVAGPLIMRFAREAKGHGVPEVMEAVAIRGGRIRGRVAVVKTIASALTIGSGGSAGREGPIVQVGSALGSRVGQSLKMSDARVRLLVASGAAGGIAAAFNAPLAGVFFALEVILQRFTARGFATVVISAVTASVIWRSVFGNQPVLDVPLFGVRHPVEMLFYVVLGIAAAFAAIAFVRSLYWLEDGFETLRIPDDLKPALGGLLLGGIGVLSLRAAGEALPYGNGLRGINLALAGELTWWVMLALAAAKILATGFTLGSGASGGVFAPSLFIGAMLGGVVGQAVHAMFPTATAVPGAYAMVGMAAVFSGAAQSPMSAILILFEMTNDYRIILPLMLSCTVSTALYQAIQHESIYTMKILRKGIDLASGRERHLLERTEIRRAILTDYVAVVLPATVEQARLRIEANSVESLVAVDESGRFVGVLHTDDVLEGTQDDSDLAGLIDDQVLPVLPAESLDDALAKLAPRGLRLLPVIDSLTSRRVLGVVSRDSLMRAYWNALAEEERAKRRQPAN